LRARVASLVIDNTVTVVYCSVMWRYARLAVNTLSDYRKWKSSRKCN